MNSNWTSNLGNLSQPLCCKPHRITTPQIVISCAYSSLFAAGTIGNLLVVSMVCGAVRAKSGSHHSTNWNHVFLYIVTLSISDGLSLILLPLTVTDILTGEWKFTGYWYIDLTLCKLHFFTESLNKVYSPWIMICLSFDRFVSVCYPTVTRFRNITFAKRTLLVLAILVLLLNSGILANADVVSHPTTGRPRCYYSTNDSLFTTIFVLILFCFGFCIPCILIVLFYGTIIYALHRRVAHARSASSQIAVKKVTNICLLLVAFYYSCFTPYWSITVLLNYFKTTAFTRVEVYMAYFIHLLPYVNSAINPIPYALLNKKLRQSQLSMANSKYANRSTTSLSNRIQKTNKQALKISNSDSRSLLPHKDRRKSY